MRSLAALFTLTLACCGGVAAAAGGLSSLSDEFEAPALTGWQTMPGDDFGDGTLHTPRVGDGASDAKLVPYLAKS